MLPCYVRDKFRKVTLKRNLALEHDVGISVNHPEFSGTLPILSTCPVVSPGYTIDPNITS